MDSTPPCSGDLPQFSPQPKPSLPDPTPNRPHDGTAAPALDVGATGAAAAGEELSAEEIQLRVACVMEVACCSESNAKMSLRRNANVVEAAIEEVLLKRRFVLIAICFCKNQEEYFANVVRTLPMLHCFSAEGSEALLYRVPWQPYFVRYDEYLPHAKTQDWEGFYREVIEAGEFALLPNPLVSSSEQASEPQQQGEALAPADDAAPQGGIVGVVTSTDGACPLVDYLNERLFGSSEAGTLGNAFQSAANRQCKFAMHHALAQHGLAHIPSVRVRSAEEAEAFTSQLFHVGGSVIVKPATGAGSEFVTLCSSATDVSNAFQVAAGLETTQQTTTDWMVVQEYVDGPEFVVDTVSLCGYHVVTDVWRSVKSPFLCVGNRLRQSVVRELAARGEPERPALPTTSLLYDRLEFVPNLYREDAESEVLRVVAYTLRVLDALGVRNGCAHCELRLRRRTGDHSSITEPVLIELNARMQGDVPRSTNLVGYDQYSILAAVAHLVAARLAHRVPIPSQPFDVIGIPQLYRSRDDQVTRYVLFLRAADDGYIAEVGRKYLTALPTFVYFTRSTISHPPNKGYIARVKQTTDLYSCPAAIVMEGTPEQLERDIASIRLMENRWLEASGALAVMSRVPAAVAHHQQCRDLLTAIQREMGAKVEAQQSSALGDSRGSLPPSAPLVAHGGLSTSLQYPDSPTINDAALALWEQIRQARESIPSIVAEERVEVVQQLSRIAAAEEHVAAQDMQRHLRKARAFVSQLQPPPLFITNSEWRAVVAAHCGTLLGA